MEKTVPAIGKKGKEVIGHVDMGVICL